MMIRSTPPASAHLALRPVPAPPPMIGRPVATLRRRRSRIWARVSVTMRRSLIGRFEPFEVELQESRRGAPGQAPFGRTRQSLIITVAARFDESELLGEIVAGRGRQQHDFLDSVGRRT